VDIRLASVNSATTICAKTFIAYITVTGNSVVGTATQCELEGPEIESLWGRGFPNPSRPVRGPTYPPTYKMGTASFSRR
jgi:hypothetical protein